MSQKFSTTNVFNLTLILFIASIPISKAITSLAEGVMALCWLIELKNAGIRQERWKNWNENRWLWGFPAYWLLLLTGMLWTEDINEGFVELNQKHYFFSLPIMWGTNIPNYKVIRHAMWAFVFSNFLVALGIIWITITQDNLFCGTPKIPSPFEQRPRASLFLAFASLYLIFDNNFKNVKPLLKTQSYILRIIILIFLCSSLIMLQGRIGIIGILIGLVIGIYCTPFRRIDSKYTVQFLKFDFNIIRPIKAILIVLLFVSISALWNRVEIIRRPFLEAITEFQESRSGYKNSEPEFSSIGMRFIYWEAYWKEFLKNVHFGIGTGDMEQVVGPTFHNHPLQIPFRKPHNQFLETAVQLGWTGLLLMLFAWWQLIRQKTIVRQPFYLMIHAIFGLSVLLDCTLSTQAGISAFMGFGLFGNFHNPS